jgi:tripartite-type tricarboxylate transporter receptor subunit TctC
MKAASGSKMLGRISTMRVFVGLMLGLLALLGVIDPAAAQTAFPNRPVKIVVPFAPGGASDILARALGQKLYEAWGQPTVVENRTGANGNLGAEFVAKARPDGYILLLTDVGGLTISPGLYPNLPFDVARELAPVSMIAYAAHLLAVKPSLPVKSVQELVALAKAQPGMFNFAHSGNGSAPHLAGVVFRQRMHLDWAEIPYRGGAAAIADVVSGQADFLFNSVLATLPYVQNNQLRAIAISSRKRSPQLPDLPTMDESGLPGFETGSWQGLMATGGTPPEIVLAINKAAHEALRQPDIAARLASLGADPLPNTPDEFGQWIQTSIESWRKIVTEAGVKPD